MPRGATEFLEPLRYAAHRHSLHIGPYTLPHPPPNLPPRHLALPRPHPALRSHSSIAQRANLLELDCQLTRDGVVVVSHDDNLSRQSGVDKDVGSLDFEVSFAQPHTSPEILQWASWRHAPRSPLSVGAAPLQGRAGSLLLTW